MLAALVSGETDLADALFLVAAILAGLAAVFHYRPLSVPNVLLSVAVSVLALAFFVM